MLYSLLVINLLAAETEGAAEGPINPILPTSNELFYGAISFAALYCLINFVLLPPVQRARNDRAATIAADKDAAAMAKQKATSASAEVDDQLAGVRDEATAIIDAARAEADAERNRLVSRAEREVNAMKELAEGEIQNERAEALESLRPEVAAMAAGAASRVTGRSVDASATRSVVDQYLSNPN